VKAKPQVFFTQVGETLSLKCSIARLDRQNRKFPPILIITEAKNVHFFACKRSGFVHQELRDFVKVTLTRVSSSWLWLESGQSVENVTRVESPFFSTWLELSPSHQKSWLESRYHRLFPNINQTPKQHYPSQLEKISRYPEGNEPEVFLIHNHIPIEPKMWFMHT